jgi:REP element-mobilizing transposase RayT
MSRNYKFHNPKAPYFVSFAVVEWLDVFTRNEYRQILLDCLDYCQKKKGMEIYAWVIMTNHMHLVFRSTTDYPPQYLLGDFKRFTSRKVIEAIKSNPKESRKEVLLKCFGHHGRRSSNCTNHQFWRHDNHPIELWSRKVIFQKINYIHRNPVVAGYVFRPEDYPYSSAVDYSGVKGLLDGVVVCG